MTFPKVAGGAAAIWLVALGLLVWAAPAGPDGGVGWTEPMIPGGWMAWTLATSLFFLFIAGCLMAMTVWTAFFPQPPRRGILQFATTPGDRLFVSLLGSAFICLIWLAAFGAPLWWALVVCLVWWVGVFRLV